MATKGKAVPAPASTVDGLFARVVAILEQARTRAVRSVNSEMVLAYWHIGREIVEQEQGGRKRAAYGEAVLEELSQRLTAGFGWGFDARNLRYMRQFFLVFPACHRLRDELESREKRNAPRSRSGVPAKRNASKSSSAPRRDAPGLESGMPDALPSLRPELSWTHYRLLLGVEDPRAREWYMREAASQQWSTRQLERQISVLYYERWLASRKKAPVRKEARDKLADVAPEEFIRDPYVLEFLNLKDYPALRESAVEQAIIENLQAFLLELGKGFSFVARQKRVRFEDEDFYVDLVFYNYLLRCFVLVDLKVGKLTHQDIGQMDSYVRIFDAHARPPGDNPTIGLILCSRKNEAIAKYSVLSENKQIFAAKYVKVLPTEAELRHELERERRLLHERHLLDRKPAEEL
jgi:predicted nuclease of restriction endonuclease-like (RecB) superfamily